jgi:hypothetical protein
VGDKVLVVRYFGTGTRSRFRFFSRAKLWEESEGVFVRSLSLSPQPSALSHDGGGGGGFVDPEVGTCWYSVGWLSGVEIVFLA